MDEAIASFSAIQTAVFILANSLAMLMVLVFAYDILEIVAKCINFFVTTTKRVIGYIKMRTKYVTLYAENFCHSHGFLNDLFVLIETSNQLSIPLHKYTFNATGNQDLVDIVKKLNPRFKVRTDGARPAYVYLLVGYLKGNFPDSKIKIIRRP